MTAVRKKRPVRRSRKKTAAPRSVYTSIKLGDDVLTALDDLAAAGVFPPRLPRTRVARIRWLVVNFDRCYKRLVSAHALAASVADQHDQYAHALAPLTAVLRSVSVSVKAGELLAPRPDDDDLKFGV